MPSIIRSKLNKKWHKNKISHIFIKNIFLFNLMKNILKIKKLKIHPLINCPCFITTSVMFSYGYWHVLNEEQQKNVRMGEKPKLSMKQVKDLCDMPYSEYLCCGMCGFATRNPSVFQRGQGCLEHRKWGSKVGCVGADPPIDQNPPPLLEKKDEAEGSGKAKDPVLFVPYEQTEVFDLLLGFF